MRRLFFFLALIGVLVVFASCSKDEDNTNYLSHNMWRESQAVTYVFCGTEASGTYQYVYMEDLKAGELQEITSIVGDYTVADNVITLSYKASDGSTVQEKYKIAKLTSEEMTWQEVAAAGGGFHYFYNWDGAE